MTGDTGQRPFGFWTTTALVVGGLMGVGIFVMPAQLAPYGWTGVVAWLVIGAGAMAITRVVAALTAGQTGTEGVVAACGAVLGPLAGVLIGWGYWVSIWTSVATLGLAAAQYLSVFWPPLAQSPMRLALAGCALIAAITALNMRGATAAGRFQVVTTLLKLVPLIVVLVILAGLLGSDPRAFERNPQAAFVWPDLTPALGIGFFAVIGFESATVAADKVQDPDRTIMRASLAGLGFCCLLFMLVCSGIVFTMPTAQLAASPAPVALFVETWWNATAGRTVAAFAVISAVGAMNCWVLIQAEVPLNMARAGLLPAWLARTDDRGVATGPLLGSSALACALLLLGATHAGAGVLKFILLLTTASTVLLYVGACVAAWVAGIKRWLAVAALAFSAWAMAGTGFEAAAWSVALMVTALPLYWLARRMRVSGEAVS